MAAARNGKLFVGGLPHGCTSDRLLTALDAYGIIEEAWVQLDEKLKPKGYGFVKFVFPEAADQVIQNHSNNAIDDKWVDVRRCSDYDYEKNRRNSKPVAPPSSRRDLASPTASFTLLSGQDRSCRPAAPDWRNDRLAYLAKVTSPQTSVPEEVGASRSKHVLASHADEEPVSRRRRFTEAFSAS
eukprot:TRINITY_DN14370_c0_g1_i2.p1 TRINITY_DN14370_c0_g1~~TRINITY_DN14370_c0_g1_i2.p1  ORF type:complete len:184 (-),score=21.15 TRINITY_DN14370_c0_g1_i2:62-613(-)